LFLQEAVGGVLMGLLMGYCLHLFLKTIDHYETEILLTLAFVMAGYTYCNYLHISGALAMVVMGLMVGNFRQDIAMSDITQEYVHKFWELVDVILNAILFILIAFVLIVIDFKTKYILVGLISIFIVLLSRIIIVYLPHLMFPKLLNLTNNEAKIISWGGLRGGLSLALVLSLPDNETKNILLIATYFCVLFSIIIQGLTIEKLAK
jgi:CPA1 family monovalent cation:H+ antiporter